MPGDRGKGQENRLTCQRTQKIKSSKDREAEFERRGQEDEWEACGRKRKRKDENRGEKGGKMA